MVVTEGRVVVVVVVVRTIVVGTTGDSVVEVVGPPGRVVGVTGGSVVVVRAIVVGTTGDSVVEVVGPPGRVGVTGGIVVVVVGAGHIASGPNFRHCRTSLDLQRVNLPRRSSAQTVFT